MPEPIYSNRIFLIGSSLLTGILFLMTIGWAYFWQTQPRPAETTEQLSASHDLKQIEYLLNPQTNPQILDPQMATPNEEIFISALFDGLTEYDSSGTKLEPALAIDWNNNADSTVWTFNLSKEAKWTDGTPLTAHDFVYSWLRELNSETRAYHPQLLYWIKNARQYHQNQSTADEVGVKALDDYTLQVTLENPTPFFDKLVTGSEFRPIPKHMVEKFGQDWTRPDKIVTSGAFVLDGYPSPGQLSVVKNKISDNSRQPSLDRINFYTPRAENIRGKKTLELYQTQIIGATQNLDSWPDKKDLLVGTSNEMCFLSINTTLKPFDDVRVRKALSLAIDREKLKEAGISQYPTVFFYPAIRRLRKCREREF